MKKLLALVLLACMVFTLVACNAPAEKEYSLAVIVDYTFSGTKATNVVGAIVFDKDGKIAAARFDSIEEELKLGEDGIDEKRIERTKAIILSMTMQERENPSVIDSKRKRRIAAGSGTSVEEVNKLLRQFEQTKKMMKQFSDPKKMKRMGFGRRGMKMPF